MRFTRGLLLAGVAGPPIFIATFLVEGATRSGYSAWRNYVSSLATGDGGWAQIVNFFMLGACSLALAAGLGRVGMRGIAVLVGIYAVGLLTAGAFVADESLGYPPGEPAIRTTHGAIHGLAGLIVFMVNAVTAFAVAFRFRRQPLWHGFARLSVAVGIAVIVLFVASTAVSVADELGALPNGPTGLIQRASIVLGFGWLSVFAYRVRRDATDQPPRLLHA